MKKYLSILITLATICACGSNSSSQSPSSSLNSSVISTNSNSTTTSNMSSSKNSSSTSASSSIISSSTTSNNSSSSSLPNISLLPKNKEELIKFIEDNAFPISLENESEYTYIKMNYPQKYDFEDYGYMNKESVHSYRYVDHSVKTIEIQKNISSNLIDYTSLYSYVGKSFIGKNGDNYINLKKFDFSNVPTGEYIASKDELNLLNIDENNQFESYLISDIYTKIYEWIYSLEDAFQTPTINNDKSFDYNISFEKIEEQTTKTNIDLLIVFNDDYSLKYCKYIYKNYGYDWNTNNFKDNTTDYYIEEYEFKYAKINNDINDIINPNEYILSDAEITLIENNSYDQVPLKLDNIKVGTSIKPFVLNVVPKDAIDRTFKIVSSSNPDIVIESYGVWKCVKPGTTTLTLVNELGLEKTLEITVYTPMLESISLSVSNSNMYVNESYQLFIYNTPYDANSTYNINVADNSIAEIEIIDDKYMIKCLKEGTTSITVTSMEFPNVSNSISINVVEKSNDNSYITTLISNTWSVYSYNTYSTLYLQFYENGRGNLYDDYGENASFTWEINGNKVTVSDVYFYYNYEYTNFCDNSITISEDGSELYVHFSDGFYTMLNETFTKSLY